MPKHSLEDLLRIMARLRAPDGCPWDKEQNHQTLLSCLIEETYEFVDAVENQDIANMEEELGDLLLQVVFHSQLAEEAGHFTFADVASGISEKLIRRHPHVFGEAKAEDAAAVVTQWDQIKQREKADKGLGPDAQNEGLLGQIPAKLPALAKAEKMQKRAAKQGFDWPDWKGPLAKVHEELREFEQELEHLRHTGSLAEPALTPSLAMAGEYPTPEAAHARLQEEYGDLLFSMVNLGRRLHIDSERALSATNQKFLRRFQAMEKLAQSEEKSWSALSLAEMDAYWNRVKQAEAESPAI